MVWLPFKIFSIYLHYFQEKNAEFDRSADVLTALGAWIDQTNNEIAAIEGDVTDLEVSTYKQYIDWSNNISFLKILLIFVPDTVERLYVIILNTGFLFQDHDAKLDHDIEIMRSNNTAIMVLSLIHI